MKYTQTANGITPGDAVQSEPVSVVAMNRQLVEIASWRLVSELYQRYPGRFRVIETHPGGGQYDCLSLYDTELRHVADFNRTGRFHVFHRCDDDPRIPEPWYVWSEMVGSGSPKSVLDRICTMIGLPVPEQLPPSTPTTLVYRFIAAFLSHAVFGRAHWECRNGFCDTSGYGGGVRDDFTGFPGARERLRIRLPDSILNQPAYRFWFLRKADTPLLCLETSGKVWHGGEMKPHSLMNEYQKTHRIWPVVYTLAGDLLP